MAQSRCAAALTVLVTACASAEPPMTGPVDAGTPDSGAAPDAARDAGNLVDAGTVDAGEVPDAGFDGGAPPPDSGAPADAGAPVWPRFPVASTWQWQLQGNLNTGYDVDVYDIDLFDTPRSTIARLQGEGRKVVCYFSAGSWEDFRDDADQFAPADLGNPLGGFPDERWLDVRSANVRRIMQARLDVARDKGCDAVEPDNVDGYTNDPGFRFGARDQLDYNRFLAREAHARGLAVGLKNDLDQVDELVGEFDFAVNEQCSEYDECDALDPFVADGKAVFVAEYLRRYVNDPAARDAMCGAARRAQRRALVLPEDLDDRFRFSCDP